MKVRLIIQRSIEDGLSEYVHFTEDFDTDVKEFLYPDHVADFDQIINADLPADFPLNFDLKRM